MVYTVDVFYQLIQQYPTWNQLKQWLETEEGGKIRVVDEKSTGQCLLRYEKGQSNMDLPHVRWFRSVVWDTIANRPVSISPPKTSASSIPFQNKKEVKDNDVRVEELLDGFMVNVMYKKGDMVIDVATRSKLDASGNFYSKRSFRELFMEAYTGLTHFDEAAFQNKLHQTIGTQQHAENECVIQYSFLAQHLEHRIVKNVTENAVYLVHECRILEDGMVQMNERPSGIPNSTVRLVPALELYPKGTYATCVKDSMPLSSKIQEYLQSQSWEFQGVVVKDDTGNRWRVRNDKYSAVKSLRGNHPTVLERFSHLYVQNLAHLYLEYYPSDVFLFSIYSNTMNKIADEIYQYYVMVHLTKTKTFADIDPMYHPHLYGVHGVYLNQLRPNHKKVSRETVILYLHKQPWQRIAFLLRKHDIAFFRALQEAT